MRVQGNVLQFHSEQAGYVPTSPNEAPVAEVYFIK
jgi:hypothetical protein